VGGEHRRLTVDLGGRLFELVDLARAEHHGGARFGHPRRDRLPDPLRCARDERDLAGQRYLHGRRG
jgi:hypothetical protein